MTSFVDDTNMKNCNKVLVNLVIEMQKSLEVITRWLRKSVLKVNKSKAEVCLLDRKDYLPIDIMFNNVTVNSTKRINV
jgi:hypothetical protein